MGMSSGGGADDLNAEINVTPLVDVMLVLLIIFMITAPMMNSGVDLDLPKTTAVHQVDVANKLVLSISKTNQVFLREGQAAGTQLTWKELGGKLGSNERIKQQAELFIEADAQLPYGVVVTAMAIAKNAGIAKVMLLTKPSDEINVAELDQNGQNNPP